MFKFLVFYFLMISTYASSFENLIYKLRTPKYENLNTCDIELIKKKEKPLLFLFEGTFQYDLRKFYIYKIFEEHNEFSRFKSKKHLITQNQYTRYVKVYNKFFDQKNFGLISYFVKSFISYNKKYEGRLDFSLPNRSGYHLLYFPQNGLNEALNCFNKIKALKFSKKDNRSRVHLMGFSWGAFESIFFAKKLEALNVQINSMLTFDAIPKSLELFGKDNFSDFSLKNVDNWKNYYQRQTRGAFSLRGVKFSYADQNTLLSFRKKVAHLAHDGFPRGIQSKAAIARFYNSNLFQR